MIKNFLIVMAVVCCTVTGLYAQHGTVSPYSFYGFGEMRSPATVENQMMGRLAMYGDSIHVNLNNPATYGKLALTTYALGISYKGVRMEDYTERQNVHVSSIEYLSLGMPLGNGFGLGFGIMPYSSLGYDVRKDRTINGTDLVNTYSADGGLNTVYVSLGYNILKDLSVGASTYYSFGRLNYEQQEASESIPYGTFDRRNSRVRGFNFNFSANYTPKIKDKYTLYTSVRVETQANLDSQNEQTIGLFSVASGEDVEEYEVDLDADGEYLASTDIKVPTTTTFGVGFGQDRKWFLGVEYAMQKYSEFVNEFMPDENVEYRDANRYAIGGYFIPDYTSFQSYFNRITYRAGAQLTKTGMVINGKDFNNYGITFGVGLPMSGTFSNVNLGFEFGRQGTTMANLIRESYLKINLGLSLNAKWFEKRQIN